MEGIKSSTSYNKSSNEIKDVDSEFYSDSKSPRYNYSQGKNYSLHPNFRNQKIFQSTHNNLTSFNKNFLDSISSKTNRSDNFKIYRHNNNNKYISIKNYSIARKFWPSHLRNRIANEIKRNHTNLPIETKTIDFKSLYSHSDKFKIKKKFKITPKKSNSFPKKYISTERNNERNNDLSTTGKILSYYYPNLFNISHNKIKNLSYLMKNDFSMSHYLFKKLSDLNYNNEIRKFKVTSKPKDKIENGKNGNKILTEKVYNFNILRNVRLSFKDSIERAKYKIFLNSFNTTKNIEINKI